MKPAAAFLAMIPATSVQEAAPHPMLTSDGSWAAAVLIVIGVLFVMALVIGPIVRALTPRETAPAQAQEESHAHHGQVH